MPIETRVRVKGDEIDDAVDEGANSDPYHRYQAQGVILGRGAVATHGVAYTGSVAVGQAVARTCAETFEPCLIEASGNDPFIVMPFRSTRYGGTGCRIRGLSQPSVMDERSSVGKSAMLSGKVTGTPHQTPSQHTLSRTDYCW